MDVLTSETCWAWNNEIIKQVTSSWSLFIQQTTCVIYAHGLQCEKWTELPSLFPQMNQQCKVCGEPAAGFHFGAFTCEGCKVRLHADSFRFENAYWGHSQDLLQAGGKQRTEMFLLRKGFNASKAQWSLNVPQGFTFNNSLCSAHTARLCVLCGSHDKQRLFPYITLTDWFL